MTVVINGTTGYSGPVGVLGDLTTTGNTILGDQSTDTLNVANGNLILDSTGELGLGVTPAAWGGVSTGRVFQTGGAAFYGRTDNSDAHVGTNFYRDSSNTYRYITTAPAAFLQLSQHTFNWWNAPSGTAGNPITFTQAMTLDASGNLGIGTASPTQKLQVKGAIAYEATNSTNVWQIYNYTDNTLRFNYNGVGGDELILDTSGNLGLGVTPTSNSLGPVYQNKNAVFVADGSTPRFWLGSNWYNNSGDKYIVNGFASLYSQQSGQHIWWNAPTGTAGNAITFTQAMTLDNSGRLVTPSQPAFRASINISPPTAYVSGGRYLNFTSVATNIGSCYDGTNKFTAPIAGRYLFSVDRALNTYGTGKTIRHPSMYFYKNGVAAYSINTAVATGTDVGATDYTHFNVSMTAILELAANDYIQVYFTYDNSPSVLYEYGTSYFQGYLLG